MRDNLTQRFGAFSALALAGLMAALSGCKEPAEPAKPTGTEAGIAKISPDVWAITTITSLVFSPDGRRLAVSGYDQVAFRGGSESVAFVNVLSVPEMRALYKTTWGLGTGARCALFLSPAGALAAQVGKGRADIYFLGTNEIQGRTPPAEEQLVFTEGENHCARFVTPAGISLRDWAWATLATLGNDGAMVYGSKGIALLDGTTLNLTQPGKISQGPVSAAVANRDGSELAVLRTSGNDSSKDVSVEVWEIANGVATGVYRIPSEDKKSQPWMIAMAHQAARLAILNEDGSCEIWDYNQSKRLAHIRFEDELIKGKEDIALFFSSSDDSVFLILTDVILVWSPAEGRLRSGMLGDLQVTAAALHPEGQYIALGLIRGGERPESIVKLLSYKGFLASCESITPRSPVAPENLIRP